MSNITFKPNTHTHTHTHTHLAFVHMINDRLQILSLKNLEYQRWVFARAKQPEKKKIIHRIRNKDILVLSIIKMKRNNVFPERKWFSVYHFALPKICIEK